MASTPTDGLLLPCVPGARTHKPLLVNFAILFTFCMFPYIQLALCVLNINYQRTSQGYDAAWSRIGHDSCRLQVNYTAHESFDFCCLQGQYGLVPPYLLPFSQYLNALGSGHSTKSLPRDFRACNCHQSTLGSQLLLQGHLAFP